MKAPPPLPAIGESPLATYGRAVAFVLPAVFVWFFANAFLVPKVEQIWAEAGLGGSKAQWLLNASVSLQHIIRFAGAGMVLGLVALEMGAGGWPRYRSMTVSAAAIAFNTAVLVGVTALAIQACLAAPLLMRGR